MEKTDSTGVLGSLELSAPIDITGEWAERRRIAGAARRVGIGESALATGEAALRATLGSCVGVCLIRPAARQFALAHVLLPTDGGDGNLSLEAPARFADTVVPHLIESLKLGRSQRHEVVAFIAGGAALYAGASQRNAVGKENGRVLVAQLRSHGIHIAGRDLGGTASRQLVVDGVSRRAYTLHLDEGGLGKAWPDPAGLLRLPKA